MHISLARKYRPRNFASVAVQSHVSNTLKGAIARGRVAHGYLLCGPRGVGKTTLARVLAMALNCDRRLTGENDTGEPCGACASCTRIWSGSASLDVVEIDAASNRGVDDARELRERAMYAPSTEHHYKVYIVDEAHMLTREAWNALLKILEEPPPRVVFVFATTEPQRIAQSAAPVLSRLQRFDLKRMSPADVRERLTTVLAEEGVRVESEALAMIARAADGSMRDALSLADQALALGEGELTAERVRDALGLVPEDEYLGVLDLIIEKRAGDIFTTMGRLVDAGVDLMLFFSGFADLLRAQLALSLGGEVPELSERSRVALTERNGQLSAGDLLRMLGAMTEAEPAFRKSAQPRLLIEALLVRFALMDRTVELEEVLRTLGGGEGGQGAHPREAPRTSPPAAPRGARADTRASAAGDRAVRGDPAERPASRAAAPRREGTSANASGSDGAPPLDPASAPWTSNVSAAHDGGGVAVAEAPPQVNVSGSTPPQPGAKPEALDANRLAERWGEVVAAVRASRRGILATALEHASPVAVTARGHVTVELDEPLELYVRAIEEGSADVLAALSAIFSGVAGVRLVPTQRQAPASPPLRLTEAAVKGERLELLCRRHASLAAAVRELDLELLD